MTDALSTENDAPRATVAEAIAAWEAKGPTSLTVALMAEALYHVRDCVVQPTAPRAVASFRPRCPMPSSEFDAAATNVRHTLRLYSLPANVARYHSENDTHDTVAERCAPMIVQGLLDQGWRVIPPEVIADSATRHD